MGSEIFVNCRYGFIRQTLRILKGHPRLVSVNSNTDDGRSRLRNDNSELRIVQCLGIEKPFQTGPHSRRAEIATNLECRAVFTRLFVAHRDIADQKIGQPPSVNVAIDPRDLRRKRGFAKQVGQLLIENRFGGRISVVLAACSQCAGSEGERASDAGATVNVHLHF